MSEHLKLVSVNIERSKHLDLILPFLEREQPDVFCAQELFERDIPQIEEVVGPCRVFGIDGNHPADPPEEGSFMEGNAIFSRLPAVSSAVHFYVGSENNARAREVKTTPDDIGIIECDIEKGGELFRILTTHFTWSGQGEATDAQRTHMKALILYLEQQNDFIVTGDFNAPRGGEIFEMLSSRYRDNIPLEYETSIDGALHRAGPLPYMVDGLFTTPAYQAHDVRLVGGVSDHMAIVAHISRA